MKKINFFSDSGKKIKTLSLILFILEVIASIISGIALCAEEDAVWLLLIPAGIILAYTSNLFMYGFGEIVDNSINLHNVKSAEAGKFDSLPAL